MIHELLVIKVSIEDKKKRRRKNVVQTFLLKVQIKIRISSKTSLSARTMEPREFRIRLVSRWTRILMKKRFHRRCWRVAPRGGGRPLTIEFARFSSTSGVENADLPRFLPRLFSPLSLSLPRELGSTGVSPVARASRNFNEASCGSQIREIVSRPARRIARHHFSTTHRCLRP